MLAEARSMLLLPSHEGVSCDIDNSCVTGNHACIAGSFNIVILSLSQELLDIGQLDKPCFAAGPGETATASTSSLSFPITCHGCNCKPDTSKTETVKL